MPISAASNLGHYYLLLSYKTYHELPFFILIDYPIHSDEICMELTVCILRESQISIK